MNILLVHNFYKQAGGEDTVFYSEKTLLEENGNKVYVYTRNNNEIKKFSLIEKFTLPFKFIYNKRTYKDITKIIKNENIDIIHVHNILNLISPSVYYAAFDSNVPVVQTVHNFRILCPNGLFYRNGKICEDCINRGLICAIKHNCYRNSKIETILNCYLMSRLRRKKIYNRLNYICLTEFSKQKLLSLKQINSNQIYIKPNFVYNSVDKISKNRKNQVVYAGRLTESKGIKSLFSIWAKNSDLPKLLIFGNGELYEYFQERISNEKLSNIELLGFKEKDSVTKSISESKATIVPSSLYEGMPMVILESYSVGTPVIANNIGNLSYLVKDGITGYKYKTLDEVIMKIKMLKEDMYYNSYNEYINKYSKDINYMYLIDIYKKVISR